MCTKKVRDSNSEDLELRDPQEIKKKIKELLKAYKNLQEKPENDRLVESIARVTGSLGTLYWKLDDFSHARSYFIKALDAYKKIDDHYHLASVWGALGSLYLQYKDYDAALHYTEKAHAYWKNKSHLNERLICFQNLGTIYKNLGQIEKAADNVLEAMRLAVKLKDEIQFAKSIQILLEHYELKEDYQMLKELKTKALEFWAALDLPQRQFKTLVDLGVIYQVLEQPDKAINSFKNAFNVAYHIGDLKKMHLAQGFIAEVYFNKRDLDRAREVYIETFKLAVYIAALTKGKKGEKTYSGTDFERINKSKLILLSLGLSESKIAEIQRNTEKEAKKTLKIRKEQKEKK